MKLTKQYLWAVWLLLFPLGLCAQSGMQEKILKSKLLQRELKYAVWLPEGYDATKRYPVIFYLHGFAGNRHEADGFALQLKDMMDKGVFPPTVLIAPDAGRSWYIDDFAGKRRYASMFMEEFVPEVDRAFALERLPARRAVMGVSMGGFGALRLAMLHPDKFGACASLMGAVMTGTQARGDENYELFHGGLYGDQLKGEQRVNAHFLQNNPIYLVDSLDRKVMTGTRWFIQCCDGDFHALPNAELHRKLLDKGIQHEYRMGPGDHNGACYLPVLPAVLGFLGKAFAGG